MDKKKRKYKFLRATKVAKDTWEVVCLTSSDKLIKYKDMTPGRKRNDVVTWAKQWCEKQNLDDESASEAAHIRYRRMMTIKFLLSGGKATDLGFWDKPSPAKENY